MQEFINMGGYAYYVWASFTFGFCAIAYLYVHVKDNEKQKYKIAKAWHLQKENRQEILKNERSILRFVFPILAILVPLARLLFNFN